MTFDEQLRREVDALSDRLRDEIAQQVRTASDAIAAVARAEREQSEAQTRAASDRAAAAIADAEARAYAYGKDEGRSAGLQEHDAASTRLVDALRAMDGARSLTSILEVLTACVAAEAERAAILLVRGDHIRHWHSAGFDPKLGDAETVGVPLDEGNILGQAVKRHAVVGADAAHPTSVPFGATSTARDAVCVPIALAGEVVAVLYADRDEATAPPTWRPRIEILGRHATRCLEALIAFKAARMLADPPAGPAVDRADVSVEDETAARRYARLLVSEIRLYHEEAVAAGRRERDLATRLGGEIARARMLYEQRVTRRVRQHADYFHDELVRTLANGDAALLELSTR